MSAQEQSKQSDQKLLIVIASDSDADSLIHKLVQRGYPATKVSSTGGFLRRGNATIFSGVDAEDVDNVVAIIRSECEARTEFLPAQALPFPESIYPAEPVEVRTGGAIVFVVGVERFERT
ncbi:MAG: cyclic-di-AMP receptor [Dehalococcoidia bacterium]|nr:cyclic-di-AMP receptor [Dehalococcoidia bacterium]